MYNVFSSISGLLKIDPVTIDNSSFKLHYKVTMFILVAFSVLLTQKQYFGDPIDCIVGTIPNDLMDTYCWIHSTYTVPQFLNGKIGEDIPHPGIGNGRDEHELKYHKYYQWVTLFLFFQAILFYLPRQLWKTMEGGKIKMLVSHLNSPIVDDEIQKERKNMLINYFTVNMRNHRLYAYKYTLCEILTFVNIIGQIFLTDRFLGYEFSTYGLKVIEQSEKEFGTRNDAMEHVFPKVTKCVFKKYGKSGTVETHDGLCVLPLNIFNEKIYIFLWFWFIILAIVTAFALVYRLLVQCFPAVRTLILKTTSPHVSSEEIEVIGRKCEYGDWFLLHKLSKNMEPLIYRDFLHELSERLAASPTVRGCLPLSRFFRRD